MLIRPVPSIVSPPTPIGVGGFRGADSLILDFYSGVLDPRVNFTGGANRTYIDSLGVLQDSSTNVARFDHLLSTTAALGLSIWGESEQGIRNNTMVGASAGTPGTPPNNWTVGAGGTTLELVAVDIVNGIKYVSYRFSGTPSGDPTIVFETSTGINAIDSETWTLSAYVALIAGDLTNINAIKFQQKEKNSGGGTVKFNSGADFKGDITTSLQRFSYSVTLSGGGTVAHIEPLLLIDWDGSGDIDLTLRIGLPQEEQGGGASPVIKTTNAAVTATADLPVITGTNFSSWYNPTELTILLELNLATAASNPHLLNISDGTSTERLAFLATVSGTKFRVFLSSAAGNGIDFDGGVVSTTSSSKLIAAFKANDTAGYLDGGLVGTDTDHVMPTVTKMNIGSDQSGSQTMSGTIGRIEIWPYAIIPTTLQELTQ